MERHLQKYVERGASIHLDGNTILWFLPSDRCSNELSRLNMTTVYLASPLGFSPEMKGYRDRIRLRLKEIGCEIFDPWEQAFGALVSEARSIVPWEERVAALAKVAGEIGHVNEQGIRSSDAILGVLDGAELDSGTVCEIGFAAGRGKRCYGLRTDFRDLGDFERLPINLQVLYFIESRGGRLFRAIDDIVI